MKQETFQWPPVAVLFITWNRLEEAKKTLAALSVNLQYPRLHLHIADDGSPEGYVQSLLSLASSSFPTLSSTVTPRKGWGANANKALLYLSQHGFRYVFQIEDDYVLTRPLDLRPGVLLLMDNERIGLVRYRGITGHRVSAYLQEFDVPTPLKDQFSFGIGSIPGRLSYWLLSRNSRELYIYSNGPHLKDCQRFHGTYGFYPEGLKLGATEERFAHVVKDGSYPVQIAVFPDWVPMWFDHIGKTHQLTPDDVGFAGSSR